MPSPANQKQGMSQETQAFGREFLKAFLANLFFLALLIGLYFANRAWNFLDHLAARFY